MAETFKERNWRPYTLRYTAVEIVLADPSTDRDTNYTTTPGASPTLYLCDRGAERSLKLGDYPGLLYNLDDNSLVYIPIIEDWSMTGPAAGFTGDFSESTATLVLLNRRNAWQQKHGGGGLVEAAEYFVKLSQLFQDYLWLGKYVTYYAVTEQFNYNVDPATGADFHAREKQQLFYGKIENFTYDEKRVSLEIVAAFEHIRKIPDSEEPDGGTAAAIISKVAYPNAPDQYIGRSIPMVFTRKGTSGTINTLTEPLNHPGLSPKLSGLWPCVVTHYNDSTTRQVRIMANKCDSTGSTPSATNLETLLYHQDSGLLSIMNGTDTSSTTELYTDFSHTDVALLYIPATTYYTHSGTTNPTRAIDGKATTFATVAGSTNILDLIVPNVGPYGKLFSFRTYVILDDTSVGAGATDATVNLEFGLWDLTAAGWYLGATNAAPKNPGTVVKSNMNLGTTQVWRSNPWTTGAKEWNAPDQPMSQWKWDGVTLVDDPFTTGYTAKDLVLRIRNVVAASTAYVISAGIYVTYYPGIDPGGTGSPPPIRGRYPVRGRYPEWARERYGR